MMKMWHINPMKYYLARKTSELYKKMDRFANIIFGQEPKHKKTKAAYPPVCVDTSL